jgi:DNA-binding NarL/FixJ family response regulator
MSHTVLIVDDSKLARMSIGKALNALHADWLRVEASNVDEARALMQDKAVEIALLDFNMPGLDGISFAKELRDTRPEMPVAIISANDQREVVARAKELGAAFLVKPLSQEALGDFLAGVVHRLANGSA